MTHGPTRFTSLRLGCESLIQSPNNITRKEAQRYEDNAEPQRAVNQENPNHDEVVTKIEISPTAVLPAHPCPLNNNKTDPVGENGQVVGRQAVNETLLTVAPPPRPDCEQACNHASNGASEQPTRPERIRQLAAQETDGKRVPDKTKQHREWDNDTHRRD